MRIAILGSRTLALALRKRSLFLRFHSFGLLLEAVFRIKKEPIFVYCDFGLLNFGFCLAQEEPIFAYCDFGLPIGVRVTWIVAPEMNDGGLTHPLAVET